MMAVSFASNRFDGLLTELKGEHEQEVSILLSEITRLNGLLDVEASGHPAETSTPKREQQSKHAAHASSPLSSSTGLSESPRRPDRSPTGLSNYTNGTGAGDHEHLACSHRCRKYNSSRDESELLELKGVWKEMHSQGGYGAIEDDIRNQPQMSERMRARNTDVDDKSLPSAKPNRGCCFCPLISPSSNFRLYWDVTGLVLVCFDMVNIPYQAFEPPVTWFSFCMDWITLLFWTMDMVQAFFTGYFEKGELVMNHCKIVKHYLKTWFPVDLLVVGPDWFLTVAGSSSEAGGFSRLLRGARAIRVLRLLRLLKLQRVMNILYDLIDNEYSFIVADLVKMMLCILALNHVIACGWFLVGKLTCQAGMTSWVVWSEMFLEKGIGYQYATALHWTLTQFTPASMDVVARNIVERWYSILVLLFAMVAFSSIVGTVTSSMTVIRQMKSDKQKQFWMLRRYLKQKGVSKTLGNRMTRFLEHQTRTQEKLIAVQKVTLLNQLSAQLASELAFEMFAPVLEGHDFFKFLSSNPVLRSVASQICHTAMKALHVAMGDTVFQIGEDGLKTYVIKNGNLQYKLRDEQPIDPPLKRKEWLAEAVLWTSWRYRGTCCADTPSELLSLDTTKFVEAMSIHPRSWIFAQRYGESIVCWLNEQTPACWTDLVRDEDFFSMVMSESQNHIPRTLPRDDIAQEISEGAIDRGDSESESNAGNARVGIAEPTASREEGTQSLTLRTGRSAFSTQVDDDRKSPHGVKSEVEIWRPPAGAHKPGNMWCAGVCFPPRPIGKAFSGVSPDVQ